MLTLMRLRNAKEEVIEGLAKKRMDARRLVEEVLAMDLHRRELQSESDAQQALINQKSREVGQRMKQGEHELAEALKGEVAVIKERLKLKQTELEALRKKINGVLVQLPNVPHSSVPEGATSKENTVVRRGGEVLALQKGALPHWELAARLGIIDFELGVKLTGSGFPVYRGAGARLERGLINYFIDYNTAAGYEEMMPPIMVNEESAYSTGQLPDKENQMYAVPLDGFYLVPTAEVPLTNVLRDVILEERQLPLKMTAYTPCFRREAGSYGKDVRGLNRLHQFDKVEIVCVEHPERSYARLDEMVRHVEQLLQRLELPYRVLHLCGGDMSFTSASTFDLEVFSAAQERWLEVSSVSNFEDFQSNRLQLRFRAEDGKRIQLAHTLNGSSLALPRIVAALLENNQTPEGVRIPAVLREWMGTDMLRWRE
ncbi:MAG: serine--tRNA ligase [Bacteroidia bacterium]|nr:serine--tRNA ligase [Bacteroidia bacterium]